MSRKPRQHKRAGVPGASRSQLVIAITIALSLSALWTMLAYTGSFDSGFKQKAKTGQTMSPQSLASGSPSKEYVYGGGGGGRLVATEEASSSGPVHHASTIGIYQPSAATFHLRNTNTGGPADIIVNFGLANWVPIVGDWDGNGTTTIGVYDPSTATFHLRNTNTGGPADVIVSFGLANWVPIVGDWDGNGTTTIGIYDPSTATFHLRNTNTGGPADIIVSFGLANWVSIVGDWDGI
jgi:hypothetical protein